MKKLPTGKVKTGSGGTLNLTDGQIVKGKSYLLPETKDGKTAGKSGVVTDIRMVLSGRADVSFWVRLEETDGQGWQFEYYPEE